MLKKYILNILFINRSSALIINNIVMLIACMTILLGTIYPIIIEVLTNNRISVGAPYFNSTVIPIILPGLLLMSVAPALAWQKNKLPKYKNYFLVFFMVSLMTFFIVYFTNFSAWAFIGILLGLLIIFSSFLAYNNSLIAHIGVGILILGVTCSSVFKSEYNETFALNETKQINKYSVKLESINENVRNNFQELIAKFIISDERMSKKVLKPSKRYYHVSKIITTEASIHHSWSHDFYVILGREKNSEWGVKIYINPFVSFIWFGAILMFFSGLIGIKKK